MTPHITSCGRLHHNHIPQTHYIAINPFNLISSLFMNPAFLKVFFPLATFSLGSFILPLCIVTSPSPSILNSNIAGELPFSSRSRRKSVYLIPINYDAWCPTPIVAIESCICEPYLPLFFYQRHVNQAGRTKVHCRLVLFFAVPLFFSRIFTLTRYNEFNKSYNISAFALLADSCKFHCE